MDLAALRGPDGVREHDLASLTLLVKPEHQEACRRRLNDFLDAHPAPFARRLIAVLWEIVKAGWAVREQLAMMASYRETQQWITTNIGTPETDDAPGRDGTLIRLLSDLDNVGRMAGAHVWERAQELRRTLRALRDDPSGWCHPESWAVPRRSKRGSAVRNEVAPAARKKLAALARPQLRAFGVKRRGRLPPDLYLGDPEIQTHLLRLLGILSLVSFFSEKKTKLF